MEPDPFNAALCRKNTSTLSQVEVVEAAIGSSRGHVILDHSQGKSWGVRTQRTDTGLPIVTVADLQSKVSEGELLIVKVDIEGFELDLFSQNTDWIAQAFTIIVEPYD